MTAAMARGSPPILPGGKMPSVQVKSEAQSGPATCDRPGPWPTRKDRDDVGKLTAEQRFWSKVDRSGDCWLWTGKLLPVGYAQFGVEGRRHVAVHRYAHELLIGPISEGFEVDHLCFVRHCVNPAHLEAVTPAENKRRMHEAMRQRGAYRSYAKMVERELREAEAGPNGIGVKAGGFDDAVHIRRVPESRLTFCDRIAATRNVVQRDAPPDPVSGCWTCLQELSRDV